ncbi:EutN/CcmL family microcompartment protein [bacterium]|nr:EutN/CcmL family microcompartment protein [bacterium]
MNLGRVIGSVWATRKTETLEGKRMLFVQPLSFSGKEMGGKIVALDTVDSGAGDTVIYVSSTEATIPFKPQLIPTDATIVGIVDRVDHVSKSWKPS